MNKLSGKSARRIAKKASMAQKYRDFERDCDNSGVCLAVYRMWKDLNVRGEVRRIRDAQLRVWKAATP
jgi:hypothetical protein